MKDISFKHLNLNESNRREELCPFPATIVSKDVRKNGKKNQEKEVNNKRGLFSAKKTRTKQIYWLIPQKCVVV
jgi:hypothetical protein